MAAHVSMYGSRVDRAGFVLEKKKEKKAFRSPYRYLVPSDKIMYELLHTRVPAQITGAKT